MSRRPPVRVRRDWGDDDDGCTILHVDMDAFFASVELARRPHLRGRPVVVGGEGRSVVLAATYEARAFGVHSAMPMAQARRLCPQAVVVPPDHDAYRAASRVVMGVLRDVTAVVEQVSVDEAFLDVSGARRRLGRPAAIADLVRRRVLEELDLTCSVGIASTKFVAKLASGLAKPDGVLLVPRAAAVELLHSLPVESLWGVGDRTREALARWGITSVRQLAEADVATLARAAGRVSGAHLHDLAWGRDPRPVVPERVEKSIGAEVTLPHDTDDLARLDAHLLSLADRCAAQLRSRGLVARTVSLKVRTEDFTTSTRSRTLPVPTDVARELHLVGRELLASADLRGQRVRLVGVRAEGLAVRSARQVTLEEAVDDAPAARRRAEVAMDAVRERFGAAALGPAALVGPSRPAVADPATGHRTGRLGEGAGPTDDADLPAARTAARPRGAHDRVAGPRSTTTSQERDLS
ncbi:DNA polymerase IV [Cellulomonas carbonis]|uniref:DNA polymerase IV n=1 Tax=Cellulomonas carbonis T26 TaxID=947969 RepID=A0A0A0BW11_9CELL|nr:DNA polymerase IV [Cellulomonas carbonis]KGM12116.1 DNA polymerase IV [Cellulomonas carbonis T26]GGB97143.1 DNA polymerase IV [Cellulomonas carbonis]